MFRELQLPSSTITVWRPATLLYACWNTIVVCSQVIEFRYTRYTTVHLFSFILGVSTPNMYLFEGVGFFRSSSSSCTLKTRLVFLSIQGWQTQQLGPRYYRDKPNSWPKFAQRVQKSKCWSLARIYVCANLANIHFGDLGDLT